MQSSKELIESGHRVVDSFRDERCGEKEREKEERSGGGQTQLATNRQHTRKPPQKPSHPCKRIEMKDHDDNSLSSVSSSESSSSSDDDNSCDGHNIGKQHITDDAMEAFQCEIRSRQRLLTKLLRGKEGTAYARMLLNQEECVNEHLLEMLRKERGTPLPSSSQSKLTRTNAARSTLNDQSPLRTVHHFLLKEINHVFPGYISLIFHCSLYVTIYGLISRCLAKLCDRTIIFLTGWHVVDNNFDCTVHERVFYFVCLIVSLLLQRMTGVLYDWNDERVYQKRLKVVLRNDWHLKTWDVRTLNWFRGGDIGNEHEVIRRGKSNNSSIKRKLGPMVKYWLDMISFFVCYLAIDHFVGVGMKSFANTRESLLEGLPSRQMRNQSSGIMPTDSVDQQCRVVGNPAEIVAGECTNVLTREPQYISDVWIWAQNNIRCGNNDVFNEEAGAVKDSEDGSFFAWRQYTDERRQTMNRRDDEYIRSKISDDAYYSFIGDPSTWFLDPKLEQAYLISMTVIGFGVLSWLGCPLLLI